MLRRLLAAECGLAVLFAALAVVLIGVSPWVFALLAACTLANAPALLVLDRIERRRSVE